MVAAPVCPIPPEFSFSVSFLPIFSNFKHKIENFQPVRVVNVFYSKNISPDDEMIHLTVPDTQILVEKTDGISKYTVIIAEKL